MSTVPYTLDRYFQDDYTHTLFPLRTTELLVKNYGQELRNYINDRLLDPTVVEHHFLPQRRCYAAKKGFHLRRTVKLDPVAEFFIYDLVFRNRQTFRQDHQRHRRSFGYRFALGAPTQGSTAYGDFKSAIREARKNYSYTITLDVATYFNSIYHHDLVRCVQNINWPIEDANALGMFLREANAGRSIDCLPQGLHPCKVLGSEFLRFIDNSYMLQSDLMLRFMDDIHLFSNNLRSLTADMLTIQRLLGERGLSLNDAKTFEGSSSSPTIAEEVDAIKAELLQMRRDMLTEVYEDEDGSDIEEDEDEVQLTEQQVSYLLNLINSPDVEESDAELVLALLRDNGQEVLPKMISLLQRFPGLTKSIYNFARFSLNLEGLDDLILDFLTDSPLATEYQLFWLVKLTEDFLNGSPRYGSILISALEHPNATVISRAKVLEIPDGRFGLPEHREERLRSGRSDWEAWAAAVGTRQDSEATRNHLLGYSGNGSMLNRLIAQCVQRM